MRSMGITAIGALPRLAAGIAVIAAIVIGFGDHAHAKGPETATITGPGIARPIELMDAANSDLVGRLMEQTGLWYATGDLPVPLEEPPGALGPRYTLTWVNAGPPGKGVDGRTIRQVIYLDAKNGSVIHTPAQEGLRGWGAGVIGWFAAPRGLQDTLAGLGVSSAQSSVGEVSPRDLVADTAMPARESARYALYLSVLGLAFGAGLAGALDVGRMLRRSRQGSKDRALGPPESSSAQERAHSP